MTRCAHGGAVQSGALDTHLAETLAGGHIVRTYARSPELETLQIETRYSNYVAARTPTSSGRRSIYAESPPLKRGSLAPETEFHRVTDAAERLTSDHVGARSVRRDQLA